MISTPRELVFLTLVVPLESVESFTLIVLNGIACLSVMIRFSTTGEACAEVLEAAERVAVAVLEATEGVAVAVAGTVTVTVAVGAPPDPQALSTSRQLTAKTILMTGLMASLHLAAVTHIASVTLSRWRRLNGALVASCITMVS